MYKISNTYLLRHIAATSMLCALAFHNTFAEGERYFDAENIAQWQHKKFNGHSEYQLALIDGKAVLSAKSEQCASALYHKAKINLDATPYLNWAWQVEELPKTDSDDSTKTGDDYAARIYVVFKTGFGFWNIGSLNYVWANQRQLGEYWPNAYTGKVVMLAVESGPESSGKWRPYKRNVAKDIKQYLGKEINTLTTVAIMTDSDDSQSSTQSYYGDIWFSAE